MRPVSALILLVTIPTISSYAQAQSATDVFDDSGKLKASAGPIVINLANNYYYTYKLPFSYIKTNNVVPYPTFSDQVEIPFIAELTSSEVLTLKKAIYGKYQTIVINSWNSVIQNKISAAASIVGSTPTSCTNYAAGTVWEVYYNAYNLSLSQAIISGRTASEAGAQAAQDGWSAVVRAFSCYGTQTSGPYPVGYIQDWDQIFSWFTSNYIAN